MSIICDTKNSLLSFEKFISDINISSSNKYEVYAS